jgi:Tol biopolymer transport system component
VISADVAPAVFGEIYRINLDGHRTDLSRSPFADTQPFVSPDGKRVAFVSDRSGRAAVYVVGIDGRGLRRISSTFDQPTIVGWSPDSRQVAMRVTRSAHASPGSAVEDVTRLYVLEPGRPQRAIVAEPDGQGCGLTGATWSPTAPVIAFSSCTDASSSVRVVTANGRSVFPTVNSADPASLTWSPAGRLAMLADGRISIFEPHGRLLARFAGNGLAWSRTGERLASMAGGMLEVRDGGGAGRVVLRRRLFPAAEIRKVVKNYGSFLPELLWVGSTRVAIGNVGTTSQLSGPTGPSPYASIDAGFDLETSRNWRPTKQAWFAGSCGCAAPDGSLIAYTRKAGAGFALRVSTPSGNDARTIATVPGCLSDGNFLAAVEGIHFAHGARSVVYQSACYTPSANLYTLSSGALHRLTDTRAHQVDPAWSPDGGRIAWSQADSTDCRGCPSTIWSMNGDGSGAHALTSPTESTWDTGPSWSPDGTQIVFSRSTISGFGRLLVVPAAGGTVRDLHIDGGHAVWGLSRIAYLGGLDLGGAQISVRTVAPDGSDPRTVATGYLASPAWSHDGRLAYLELPPNGAKPRVHVIDGAGTQRYALPLAQARSLVWSSDGQTLLVVARAAVTGPFDVYALGADGRNLTRVTTNLDVLGADATS